MQNLTRLMMLVSLLLAGISINVFGQGTSPRASGAPITQFPFKEDFDATYLMPEGWTLLDEDEDGRQWGIWSIYASSGMYAAASFSYTGGPMGQSVTPDNWLITPQLVIPNSGDFELSFNVAVGDVAYSWQFNDHYSVLVSTSGTNAADFTEIHSETMLEKPFKEVKKSLAAYKGQSIYIAFRHHNCHGQAMIIIDDVAVSGPPPPAAQFPLEENFDASTEIPTGWLTIDNNNDALNWLIQSTCSGSAPFSITSRSYTGGPMGQSVTPDNWLITPQLAIPNSDDVELSFHVGVCNPGMSWQFNDHYSVLVSTSGTNVADFTEIHSETLDEVVGSFKKVRLPLKAYKEGEIYIAFRHHNCKGQAMLAIDDVAVTGTKPSEITFPFIESFEGAAFPPEGWSIYDKKGGGANWSRENMSAYGGAVDGDYAVWSTSGAIGGPPKFPDTWLITPQLHIGAEDNLELSYWVGTTSKQPERYTVYISETGTDEIDFVQIYTDAIETEADEYTKEKISLNTYKGKSIYIAFRHHPEAVNSRIKLDYISVAEPELPTTVFPFIESFEGAAFPPEGWSIYDKKGGGANWSRENMSAYGGAVDGDYAVWSTSGAIGGPPKFPDTWLITPQLHIGAEDNLELSYWVGTTSKQPERYTVYISETGTDEADFVQIYTDAIETEADKYKKERIHLNAYKGKSIYIAFRHHPEAVNSRIKLDNIRVAEPPTTPYPFVESFEGAAFPPEGWSIYDKKGNGANWSRENMSAYGGAADGDYAVWSTSGAIGGPPKFPDTWLITPQLHIGIEEELELSYWVGVTSSFNQEERYSVYISTTGTEEADFVQVYTDAVVTAFDKYKKERIHLNAYKGKSIYIAFRHHPEAVNSRIKLDNIRVAEPPKTSYPFVESFEGAAFPPEGWSIYDKKGNGANWSRENMSAYGGAADGDYAVWSTSGAIGGPPKFPDTWLITPQLHIGIEEELELSYWVGVTSSFNQEERYSVYVSTTGTEEADFTQVYTDAVVTDFDKYKKERVSLASYKGQSIYIAFRHHPEAVNARIKLDNIRVDVLTTDYPFVESFEGATFPPKGWSIYDKKGNGANWSRENMQPYGGAADGNYAVWSTSGAIGGPPKFPDTWLITPQLHIGTMDELELSYWVGVTSSFNQEERYSVYVSTTGTEEADFTQLFTDAVVTDFDKYKRKKISLTDYKGKSIYIAFRHHPEAVNARIKLDNIRVGEPLPTTAYPFTESFEKAAFPPEGWSIYDKKGNGANWTRENMQPYGGAADGNYAAWSASGAFSGPPKWPDTWLITPQLHIDDEGEFELSYWVGVTSAFDQEERYSVYVSTTGTAEADFKLIYTDAVVTDFDKYKEERLPLTAYQSKSIYIAFRHHPEAVNARIKLDNIRVGEPIAVDGAVVDILSPISGGLLSDQEAVTITVANYSNIVLKDIPVALKVNDKIVAQEVIKGVNLGVSEQYEYTFETTVDLSVAGLYTLQAYTELEEDTDTSNDAFEKGVTSHGNIIVMGSKSPVSACNIRFVDDGLNGSYGNTARTQTMTILPEGTRTRIRATFNALNLYAGTTSGDTLYIYNGTIVGKAYLLAALTGNMSAVSTYTSTSPDGALTFVFKKSGTIVAAGWDADIACVPKTIISDHTATICSNLAHEFTPVESADERIRLNWEAPFTQGIYGGINGKDRPSFNSGSLVNATDKPIEVVYAVTPVFESGEGETFTISITVNPNPVLRSRTATICSRTAYNYTPNGAVIPAGTVYNWEAPAVEGISGTISGTEATTFSSGTLINSTNMPKDVIYTVTPISNGCQGETFTVAITVNPQPSVTSETTTICSGSFYQSAFTGIIPAGTTYSWSAPSVSGITGTVAGDDAFEFFSGALNNNTPSAKEVVYQITPKAGDCVGEVFTVKITVQPIPILVDYARVICNGKSASYTPSGSIVPAGTTYSWEAPSVTGITGTTAGNNATSFSSGTLVNSTPVPINVSYAITPKTNDCTGATFNVVVTVNPTLTHQIEQTICKGTTYNFFGTTLTEAGNYEHVLQSQTYGCDSIIYLTLFVKDCGTPVTGITIAPESLSLGVGASAQLTATITPENATNKNVIWLSNDWSVAQVDNNGNVTATGSGSTYIVAITEDGHFKDSTRIETTVGIALAGEPEITVYPNPAKENLMIVSNTNDIDNAIIYDLLGRVVYETGHIKRDETHVINLTELNNGIYIIRMNIEGVLFIRKVVKN